jgi:hypothetical protein
MTFVSPNDVIPCHPYITEGVTSEAKKGLAFVKQKKTLFPVVVLFDVKCKDRLIKAGSKLYLKQEELETHDWGKKGFEMNGKSCILVEMKFVVLIEKPKDEEKEIE